MGHTVLTSCRCQWRSVERVPREKGDRETDRCQGYLRVLVHSAQHVSREGSVPQTAMLHRHHTRGHTVAGQSSVVNLKTTTRN